MTFSQPVKIPIEVSLQTKFTLKKYKTVIKLTDSLIKIGINSPEIYKLKGLSHLSIKEYRKAIECFDHLISIDSLASEEIIISRGISELNNCDKLNAKKDFNTVINLNPSNELAILWRGRCNDYSDEKQYEKAVSDFKKVLELNKFNHEAYFELSRIYLERRDYYNALENIINAIQIRNIKEYQLQKGNVEFEMADYAKCIESLSLYLERGGSINRDYEYYSCVFKRGHAKMFLGDYFGAILDFNKASKFDNGLVYKDCKYIFYNLEAVSLFNRGICYFNLGKFNSALKDIDAGLKLEKEDRLGLYYKGLIEIKLNRKVNGCIHLSRSGELGYEKAFEAIREFCK